MMLRKCFALTALFWGFAACTGDIDVEDDSLPVTVHNISGDWKLVESNGEAPVGESFFYIKFIRKERTFKLWTNFNSYPDSPASMTGSFNIVTDEYPLLIGNYDFGYGDWNDDYIVTLTSDTMIWVAEDDKDFVLKFVRVDKIPYDVE